MGRAAGLGPKGQNHEPQPLAGRRPMSDDLTERLCEEMHDRYETAAIGAGWQTNPRSRVPWADVPEANKVTMRAAVAPIADEIGRQRIEIERLRGCHCHESWDTLSQSFGRSLTDWRKPLTLAAWAYLTAHLTRVLPERYDPLRRIGADGP